MLSSVTQRIRLRSRNLQQKFAFIPSELTFEEAQNIENSYTFFKLFSQITFLKIHLK